MAVTIPGRGMLGRRRRRPEPNAAPRQGSWASAGGESGVALGRLLGGDRALPVAGGVAVLSPERVSPCGAAGCDRVG